MRRKLLITVICLLVTALIVSCGKVTTPKDTNFEFDVDIIRESADESSPAPAVVTGNTVDLSETEKAETVKSEKFPEKNENPEDSVTKESSSKGIVEKIENDELRCTLSVRCDNIFGNIDDLDKEKVKILPPDGMIFPKTEVVFYEGESVFNVLTRELKKNKIHIDFVNTPMYNTVYIRGISNLYEQDCGDLSGWIYKVNGKVPGYGCSQCILNDGDIIEFVYTCSLGKDVD